MPRRPYRSRSRFQRRALGAIGLLSAFLAACSGPATTETGSSSSSAPAPSVPTSSNVPPTIAAAPVTSASVGTRYALQPVAQDANGDPLTFSIQNKPGWATFDPISGLLSGTPAASDVGIAAGIVISVSDGRASASLAAFSINVSSSSTGSATITWEAPSTNTDGSPLADLSGYRLRFGTNSAALDRSVEIQNPAATSHTITGLTSGNWYFSIWAYNSAGVESPSSSLGSKAIP